MNPAKLLVCSNNFPHVSDASNAIFRRLILVKFDRIIPTDLQKKWFGDTQGFRTELPGIINWALQAYGDVSSNGNDAFRLPTRCEEWIEEVKNYSNMIMAWAEECCDFDRVDMPIELASKTTIDELFSNYRQWCERIELNFKHRLNKITFSRKLYQSFYGKIEKGRTNYGRYVIGISLKIGASR